MLLLLLLSVLSFGEELLEIALIDTGCPFPKRLGILWVNLALASSLKCTSHWLDTARAKI